ncbi:SRPBCC family protein [Nonomuraea typhae]|uniref:SRPBCC family protein n=1 Tax=Nonomuraea typhae TaxID=2603600 RepID=A0ABW7Z9Q4_9ACTN
MNEPVEGAGLDPIDRLAILAAALPGAVVGQRRIAAPFEAVWQVIADLEDSTPRYEPGVARVRVVERRGEFLRLLVQDTAGREHTMEARLRPGWCVMQSASVVVAFAARRLGDETLLAHLEQRRTASGPREAALAKIDRELRTIERLAAPSEH